MLFGMTVDQPEARVVCTEPEHHVSTSRYSDGILHWWVLCVEACGALAIPTGWVTVSGSMATINQYVAPWTGGSQH